MAVQNALALNFRGVRGEHRLHGRSIEEGRDVRRWNSGRAQALEGEPKAALLRCDGACTRSGLLVAPIFGDIGQLMEVAEGSYDVLGLRLIESGYGALEASKALAVMAAAILDGGAPDAFHQREGACACVLADRVAQDSPK